MSVSQSSSDTVFSLQGRGLKFDTAEQLQPHLEALDKLTNVQHIILSGNTFGVEAAQAFAKVLKTKNDIKVLDLSDIFTGRLRSEIPPSLTSICDAIMDKNLLELNLSDNAFGPAGAEPLVDFLINNKALQVLRLNNNGLGIQGGTFIAKALIQAHEKHVSEGRKPTLRTIVAGRNRLENGSSELLAQAFKAHDSLIEIRLPQNGIRPEGVVTLMKALATLKNLEIVDLQDNTFTTPGAKALASALPNWANLRTLNVGDCLLKSQGGKLLAQALISSPLKELTDLILTYNEIDSEGALQLSSAIKGMPKLARLELNGNNFEAESDVAQSLKDALSEIKAEEALGSLSDMEILSDDEEEEDDEVDELTEKLGELSTA